MPKSLLRHYKAPLLSWWSFTYLSRSYFLKHLYFLQELHYICHFAIFSQNHLYIILDIIFLFSYLSIASWEQCLTVILWFSYACYVMFLHMGCWSFLDIKCPWVNLELSRCKLYIFFCSAILMELSLCESLNYPMVLWLSLWVSSLGFVLCGSITPGQGSDPLINSSSSLTCLFYI